MRIFASAIAIVLLTGCSLLQHRRDYWCTIKGTDVVIDCKHSLRGATQLHIKGGHLRCPKVQAAIFGDFR